ncbi:MAG: TonB-dependent receptor, partial [Erythrobacter sp.]
MKVRAFLLAGICLASVATPAFAQTSGEEERGELPEAPREVPEAPREANVIIVTAQRQAQSLQEVPLAVTAFDAETLQAQQIENASDLQLTLPNVSFTKGNFTGSSFTIR